MKVQILSDLHLERGIHPCLRDFEEVGDVLVLDGDIATTKTLDRIDYVFSDVKVPILYIPGNHEYYGDSIELTDTTIKDYFAKQSFLKNIHVLNDDHFDLEGIRFTGSTYWCNPSILEENRIAFNVSDFISYERVKNCPETRVPVIEGMTINKAKYLHSKAMDYIKWATADAREKDLKNVVITHFPPSWQAQELRFRNSDIGSYFYNRDDDFVELIDPVLWIYGHTHGNLRFKCGDVPVTTNQLGYWQGLSGGRVGHEPCFSEFDLNYIVEI